MKSFLLALVAASYWLVSQSVMAAAPQADVAVQLIAHRIETLANGQEKLDPAERAKPGDLIEYQAVYTNRGKAAAHNLAATLPIPATGLEYLADSSMPTAALGSIDGQHFSALPLMRSVKAANGQSILQAIPTNEYRYLRWNLGELAAGASVTVSARMRVSTQFKSTTVAAR